MTSGSERIHTVGVIGAGAMGAGIAQVALTGGFNVILHDANGAALAQAREQIGARILRLVEKRQLEASAGSEAIERLETAESLQSFKRCDLVIEAIIEKLEPKRELFASLEKIVAETAVLATNTSSLSVAAIASGCAHRERIVGMHFFNPVPLMKLVEIIRAPESSERALAVAQEASTRMGKTAVLVTDVPGFLVNLIGRAYSTEALHIVQEGVASVATVDTTMREACGFRMGPFELMDLTGIDVNFPASTAIWRGFQHDPRLKTNALHESLFNAGRFGRKTGRGFHDYPEAAASVTPAVQASTAPAPAPGGDEITYYAPDSQRQLAELEPFGLRCVERDRAEIILLTLRGDDAATAVSRLALARERVVAIDLTGHEKHFYTVMAPTGGAALSRKVAALLQARGARAVAINDSPGFVAPRILAMIANLGCEVAQLGIGTPDDIDRAMRLAQNYPRGPLEWAEWMGVAATYATLSRIHEITGSDRYRPSLWLRRRALLNLPIHTLD